ncbi:MAG: aminotransferase class I/II-fold pyridoxal phosphate-dependent enzyme [Chloroflexi bacterium]|nr:aminotransferase class I/II-fold pyridoxal phosphate-dependent enzyme [Chloroflexota bacterium]MCI0575131.1 aminotransferase class I/II-fold pyridoxal phosphate-dependent enzyme [Chloroflexota bacterium]MCI0646280.1 aminotransferase class I/II-fold pyridoxal phosphate-dependent enzyme [Chloroflexota bacterium]MCI0728625.1 aminotransferase class I/II-fold pyridoxal phosphate-dependent enzyme [Chloroflexota bacterium]
MDIFEKCSQFTAAREAQAAGLYPYFIPLEETEGTEVTVHGRRIIMIGSNNYLGLTTHPKVRQAAIDGITRYGTSCTGSRFLNGTLRLHQELEERLAAFVGKEAALVFSTGMQVNLGVISALVGPKDTVIIDKDNHASIVDGCRLSLGEMKRYRHGDLNHLERILESLPADSGKLVVVDGVFSMGGDIVDLPGVVALCKKYGARLYVDDAHSLGVLGDGRGTAAHFGLTGEVDLIMGTFSKSFASVGGFVAGDADILHYIQHHARSLIFSASLPPPNVMAVMAALDIMENEPEHVQRLWRNGRKMLSALKELGFNTAKTQTPIIPIIIGENEPTFLTWRLLFEHGLYTNPVVAPAVPQGQALLRTSYMATHTEEQLDCALDILASVGRQLGLIS